MECDQETQSCPDPYGGGQASVGPAPPQTEAAAAPAPAEQALPQAPINEEKPINVNLGNGCTLTGGDVNANAGKFKDANGKTTYGASLDGNLLTGDCAGDGVGKGVGVNGRVGATVTDSQLTVGGTGGLSAELGRASGDYGSARAGVALGPAAEARVHYGKDPDGFRSYGVGADVGPVSFDVKAKPGKFLNDAWSSVTDTYASARRWFGR